MDFKFVQNPVSGKWIISAPRRAKRPDIAKGEEPTCPFCPGSKSEDKEVYRIGGKDNDQNWQVRVVNNKFPFAPIHEVIVHSPDHHKNFDELPLSQSELVFRTYRQRFQTHQDKGQVYIFHNHGEAGGESLPHPHSQLAVVPDFVNLGIAPLDFSKDKEGFKETEYYLIFAPLSSEWPDEVWIAPKRENLLYSEISDAEITDLAKAIYRLTQIFDLRHGHEFPFNFYISSHKGWYLRIVPRLKNLGGFEIGTGISINTQDPRETIAFIKEHFESPDEEKIKTIHRARYRKSV
jgi:UDPglucose--hexose-1-phosphate uridylyltransferase